MATTAQQYSWKNGFREPSKATPWVLQEKHIVDEENEASYVAPPSSEILTSTVHNSLGLNTLRTWPTIYNGTSSPHGLPAWWKPNAEVDVLICGGRLVFLDMSKNVRLIVVITSWPRWASDCSQSCSARRQFSNNRSVKGPDG